MGDTIAVCTAGPKSLMNDPGQRFVSHRPFCIMIGYGVKTSIAAT